MSEGALFKNQVGEDWYRAPEHIRKRFEHDPAPGEIVRYIGVMDRVECSPLGKVIGWLVQHTGALMPHEGCDVPVEIEVWSDGRSGVVHKRRSYRFPARAPFLFQSRMQLEADGKLAEHVGGGFGMYVLVAAVDDALHFTDGGFFLQLGPIRLSLPRFLGPGRVHLVHKDRGPTEFEIEIEITHPWFGQLFYQRGQFAHASSTV